MRTLLAAFILLSAFAQSVAAEDAGWPHWRGPNASGVAQEASPPLEWGPEKNIRWKAPLPGEGSSTPIVLGNRVFVLAAVPTDRISENPPEPHEEDRTVPPKNFYQFTVLCLSRETGEVLWRRVAREAVPISGRHETHTYAAGSPTTDGQRLYVSFCSMGVYAYDLEGNLLWERDLGKMRTRRGWGEANTPVIHGDSLVVNWDQEDQSFITVLDAATGQERWRKERDEPTSWSTPLVVEHVGRTQVIVNATNRVRSYDLATGEVIWECGGQSVNAIPSPLLHEELAICMSGYQQTFAAAVPLSARGDVTDTETVAWSYGRGTPYVPSGIVVDGLLYFTRTNTAVLTCLEADTGKVVYSEQRLPEISSIYASPVAADGRIYITGRDGTTLAIRAGREFEVLAVNKLDDPIDASPAIVGNQMFLRSNGHLYCVQETAEKPDGAARAIDRAVALLAREVPAWPRENDCYSCHNNGDGIRALYIAKRHGCAVPAEALAQTTRWLLEPASWKENGGDQDYDDPLLFALQFGGALLVAHRSGEVDAAAALRTVARQLAPFQREEGSFRTVEPGLIGSPINYGGPLATARAAELLEAADREEFADAFALARNWLRGREAHNTMDAAATLLGLANEADAKSAERRGQCRTLLLEAQQPDGGWGPYRNSASEPFDTALALLALASQSAEKPVAVAIASGRSYLLAAQESDGGWPGTTRPTGVDSYAHRISTTAWALQALLETSGAGQ